MDTEKTLAIIKPKAFASGYTGPMITQIEAAGFRLTALFSTRLTLEAAQVFYAVHAGKPFYADLCAYMASGTLVAMVLEKEGAIEGFRRLIGATDPAKAAAGTLRQQFGVSLDHNAIHGSDGPATAAQEIRFFFGSQQTGTKECCGGGCS